MIPLFSDLSSPEFDSFRIASPDLYNVATRFGQSFEAIGSKFLLPAEERGGLEVFSHVGLVVARNVLDMRFVDQMFADVNQQCFYQNDENPESYYASLDNSEDPLLEAITTAYSCAIHDFGDVTVGQSSNRYKGENIEPHVDNAAVAPLVLIGNGPGHLEVGRDAVPHRLVSMNDADKFKIESGVGNTVKIEYGVSSGDIVVFDGRNLVHRGCKNMKQISNGSVDGDRFSVVTYANRVYIPSGR